MARVLGLSMAVALCMPLWSQRQAPASAPAVPTREELPAAIRAVKAGYRPLQPAEVARAKAGLEAAVRRLGRLLDAGGANGQAWKDYLLWKDLQSQLLAKPPDPKVLNEVLDRFEEGHPGLELPMFVDVARALEVYLVLAQAAADDQAQQHYEEDLEELAAAVEAYSISRDAEAAEAIGRLLGRLEGRRQAAPIIAAVRRRLSFPNIYLQASESVIGGGIEGPVDETQIVTDVILGTRVRGPARTVGVVDVDLVPSRTQAVFDIKLSGTTYSDTVGRNGPATIYTDGVTSTFGSKRVSVDANGVTGLPPLAQARTRTTVKGLCINTRFLRRIIYRVAQRRVREQKGQAEYIAARHAEVRIQDRMNARAEPQLAKLNQQFEERFREPLMRRGAFPQVLRFSSTDTTLDGVALLADASQLASPTGPLPPENDRDVAVRVHESLVNNLADTLLAGVTLTEEKLNEGLVDLLGELPEGLKSDPEQEPWSMTFARRRPVSATFSDGGFQVTLRGRRYTSGERTFGAMNVTATYKIEEGPAGIRAVRQGDLDILPPDFKPGDTLSVREQSLVRLLERRFGKIFEPELKGEGIVIEGQKGRPDRRLGLANLNSQYGWMSLSWNEEKPQPSA